MKKLFPTLMALTGTMSINAQLVKIYSGDQLLFTHFALNGDKVVFEKITGTAEAIIFGETESVNWIQLWKDGPKFADRIIKKISFQEAIKTGSEFMWGANWCIPSKEDMNELLKAILGDEDAKVTFEYAQVGGKWGFKFTGKEAGFTCNSLFLEGSHGTQISPDDSAVYCSSSAASDNKAWVLSLFYDSIDQKHNFSNWTEKPQDDFFFAIPVLKE